MVKSTVEISQNFVAFSEYANFNKFHVKFFFCKRKYLPLANIFDLATIFLLLKSSAWSKCLEHLKKENSNWVSVVSLSMASIVSRIFYLLPHEGGNVGFFSTRSSSSSSLLGRLGVVNWRIFFAYSRVRNKRTPLNKHSPWNIWQKQ